MENKCDICGNELTKEMIDIQETYFDDDPCFCSLIKKISDKDKFIKNITELIRLYECPHSEGTNCNCCDGVSELKKSLSTLEKPKEHNSGFKKSANTDIK